LHFRFGRVPGEACLDDIRIVELASGKDLAPISDFEGGPESFARDWTTWPPDPANTVGTVAVKPSIGATSSAGLHVTLRQPPAGPWPDWHIYHLPNLEILRGQRYRVSFWAKAEPARDLTVAVYRPGNPFVLLGGPPGAFEAQIQMAAQAGVDFVSFPIDLPWPAPGQTADWTAVDHACAQVLQANPRALLIPRFGAEPPEWWRKAHPEAVMTWDDGSQQHHAVVASPISYFDRGMGGSAPAMTAAESVVLAGKLWLVEDDTRTHLGTGNFPGAIDGARDAEETLAMLRRNVAQEATRNFATWWMDLAMTGWFNDPRLWEEMKLMESVDRLFLDQPLPFKPQVAAVIDEQSMLATSASAWTVTEPGIYQVRRPLGRLGAPYGQYLLDDVLRGRVAARLYVFLNAWHLSAAQRRNLDRHTRHAFRIWCYAPGLYDTNRESPEAMRELTGFHLAPVSPPRARLGNAYRGRETTWAPECFRGRGSRYPPVCCRRRGPARNPGDLSGWFAGRGDAQNRPGLFAVRRRPRPELRPPASGRPPGRRSPLYANRLQCV
jgi:hypothetical protein